MLGQSLILCKPQLGSNSDDDIKSFGNPQKWYESRDNGVSWKEIMPENLYIVPYFMI